MNDNYFGISNEFRLSVFVVEPSSNHFFSPRRSSVESFGYYHFLRVDDYGAGAEAVGLAGSSLPTHGQSCYLCRTLSSRTRRDQRNRLLALRACLAVEYSPADFHAPEGGRFGAIKRTNQ